MTRGGPWLRAGARVYVAAWFVERNESGQDAAVCPATVVRLDGDEVEVNMEYGGRTSSIVLPKHNVFQNEHVAAKKILAQRLKIERDALLGVVPNIAAAYPSLIRPIDVTVSSSHPLRAGEPGVVFSAQSNVWGKKENPQKILQIAGSIWQDIRAIFQVLFMLSFAGDYSKKLMGKYLVIEMQSLFAALVRLNSIDPKYRPSFKTLKQALGRLDQELRYPTIRNKVAAHRDGDLDVMQTTGFWRRVTRYNLSRQLDIFQAHISTLHALYPTEVTMYFADPIPMPGIQGGRRNPDGDDVYEPFDPPWTPAPTDPETG